MQGRTSADIDARERRAQIAREILKNLSDPSASNQPAFLRRNRRSRHRAKLQIQSLPFTSAPQDFQNCLVDGCKPVQSLFGFENRRKFLKISLFQNFEHGWPGL
jgi:hypothetical protein